MEFYLHHDYQNHYNDKNHSSSSPRPSPARCMTENFTTTSNSSMGLTSPNRTPRWDLTYEKSSRNRNVPIQNSPIKKILQGSPYSRTSPRKSQSELRLNPIAGDRHSYRFNSFSYWTWAILKWYSTHIATREIQIFLRWVLPLLTMARTPQCQRSWTTDEAAWCPMVTWPNITGFLQDQSDDDLDEHQEGVGPELPGQLQQSTPLPW